MNDRQKQTARDILDEIKLQITDHWADFGIWDNYIDVADPQIKTTIRGNTLTVEAGNNLTNDQLGVGDVDKHMMFRITISELGFSERELTRVDFYRDGE